MSKPFLLSVFDESEVWSKPYIDAGWRVLLWDMEHEGCILEGFTRLQMLLEDELQGESITGILAAPPCTDLTVSGNQYWDEKDQGERWWQGENPDDAHLQYFKSTTERSICLVRIVLALVERYQPQFWVLENPVGRIPTLVPELEAYRKMTFNPCDFGDPYTKRTILWGDFNANLIKTPVEPEFVTASNGDRYSKIHWKTGGGSKRTKTLRSQTPEGFARAFFEANNNQYQNKDAA